MTQINITNETHNHKVIINNETRTVEIFSTGKRGLRGELGVSWLNDSWSTEVSYSKHQALLHEGSTYRVIEDHVSSAATEPGKGPQWQTVWMLLALGSDVESIDIVAGLSAEIIITSNNIGAIQEAASEIEAIKDAPQAAITAGEASGAAAQYAIDASVSAGNASDFRDEAFGFRNQAETFADNAKDSEDQTGLDRIAVRDDAFATAADRIATGADRVATGNARTDAINAAQEASGSAILASNKAGNAEDYANAANESLGLAEAAATASEEAAGISLGAAIESKFWRDQAQQFVTGDAASINFTPNETILSTNVQLAIEEVDSALRNELDLKAGRDEATGFSDAELPPESPTIGHRWLQRSTGVEYIWFEDIDSGQWIELGSGGSGPPGPPGPPGSISAQPIIFDGGNF